MSGYPNKPYDYGYGAPPSGQPYGTAPPYSSNPYGTAPPPHGQGSAYAPAAAPYAAPYGQSPGQKPPKDHSQSYGSGDGGAYAPAAAPYAAPYGPSPGQKPPKDHSQPYGSGGGGYPPSQAPPYSNPLASLVPSAFPPGTDPNVIACFQMADQDGSGLIDDKELQMALSSYNQSFSLRTVHLLMYHFTNTNTRKIGPKEFTSLFYNLQNWRSIFERFDKDGSGKIDLSELRDALLSMGLAVSPTVLDLLVSKFDKTGGRIKAVEYDNFIECCLTVKGLTEKFKEKDTNYSGSATFTYESFMLTVLPFLIA